MRSYKIICFFLLFLCTVDIFAVGTRQDSSHEKKRAELIEAAKQYLGTPYKYAGITNKGMDCSGLVYATTQQVLSIQVPRSSHALGKFVTKIKTEDMLPGDLVFFNTTGKISHVGIYLGARLFIHSASEGRRTGVIVSSLDNPYWKRCYRFAGRLPF